MSLSRRKLFEGAAAGLLLAACKPESPASCIDTHALSASAAAVRSALAYVDEAPSPDKSCAACRQYVAAKTARDCGTCKVLEGPIHPRGSCKSFGPKE